MNILYDGFIYSIQNAGGINRYFSEVISKLPETHHPTLTVSELGRIHRPHHPNLRLIRYKSFRPGRVSRRLEKHFFRFFSSLNYDVIHPTYYYLLSRQEVKNLSAPVVINVWDMLHEIFGERMDPLGEAAAVKRQAILSAQVIICISENTKKDLLERYPSVEEKVSVIHLAPSIDESLSHGPEPVPSRPYYLYVGSREAAYKNFDGLLLALRRVISSRGDVALCVVGPPFNKEEQKLIADLGLNGSIEHYGYASDNHLAKLYRSSVALAYTSLYEGFGIPPLEAMACGTAVIASDCSSIPEVVGDAGLLIKPGATRDLADAMISIFDSPTERSSLISKGRERVLEFSWDMTARQTVELYQAVSNKTIASPSVARDLAAA
jgi:glycosyltransferase involved in cell wall biosynthesis